MPKFGKKTKNIREDRPWTPKEDAILLKSVEKYGSYGKWDEIAKDSKLSRSAPSCCERWYLHLRPEMENGPLMSTKITLDSDEDTTDNSSSRIEETGPWRSLEDAILVRNFYRFGTYNKQGSAGTWAVIAKCSGLTRSASSCCDRWHSYLKEGPLMTATIDDEFEKSMLATRSDNSSTKGISESRDWTPIEDVKLVESINKIGSIHLTLMFVFRRWHEIAKCSGLSRSASSCRERWFSLLRPDLKKGPLTTEEESRINEVSVEKGYASTKLDKELPGRKEVDIKKKHSSSVPTDTPPNVLTAVKDNRVSKESKDLMTCLNGDEHLPAETSQTHRSQIPYVKSKKSNLKLSKDWSSPQQPPKIDLIINQTSPVGVRPVPVNVNSFPFELTPSASEAMKLKLPSLQHSASQVGSRATPSSLLPPHNSADTLIQSPSSEHLQSQSYCPSLLNRSLLEESPHESQSLKHSNNILHQQFSDSSFMASDGVGHSSLNSLESVNTSIQSPLFDPMSFLSQSVTPDFVDTPTEVAPGIYDPEVVGYVSTESDGKKDVLNADPNSSLNSFFLNFDRSRNYTEEELAYLLDGDPI